MPAHYTVDLAAGVVRVQCSGVLTNEEMLACIEQVFRDPARRSRMATVVDFQHVESMQVTPEGMEAAAAIKAALIDPAQEPWGLAFVAPQDEAFWVARTYEVLRVGAPERVRVFRQLSEAERWVSGLRAIAPVCLMYLCA